MKKFLLVLLCLGFLFFLVGCNDATETVKVKFIADDSTKTVKLLKGSSIYYDDIPDEYKENWIALYFDNEYKNNYNNEEINTDIDIYVKIGGKKEEGVEELNKELEERIRQDFLKQNEFKTIYDEDTSPGFFYGLYNGAAVFFQNTGEMYEKTSYICDLPFIYNYGWRIIVWKDGNFYDLEKTDTILENHILTIDDIEKIHNIHSELHADIIKLIVK